MKVLLVEDDRSLGAGICEALAARGHSAEWLRDGVSAIRFCGECDCAILDWRLPGASGLEVLRAWRRRKFNAPTLMLTARDAVCDRVAGLDAGADDYLVKPFAVDELAARLRAIVRRNDDGHSRRLQAGGVSLDPDSWTVARDGTEVRLTPREFDLLRDLVANAGRVRTREQLESAVYGWRDPPDGNNLDVCVHHLRAKIGAGVVRTVRGVGYIVNRK